jgi:myo-inositol-1(or 4)-monophosphatase
MSGDPLPPPSLPLRQALRDTAIEAVQVAGRVLLDTTKTGFRIHHKNAVNLVTDADRKAEQAAVDQIRKVYPDHQILAEERGMDSQSQSPFKWIIDPLDGTTNYAHGFPSYCVSIGLEYQQQCFLGVVLDPTRQELFVGETGRGASLNGRPIRVSKTPSLDAALLVTGFAYDIRESTDNNLGYFARFSLCAQGVRRTGTAALDLCYVACGRLDGYWEFKLSPWDMAAGMVIVQEAGGKITDFQGGPFSVYGQQVVASNGLIHEAMLRVIHQSSPGPG